MIVSCFRRFSKFCEGCGVMFQHKNTSLEGFIEEHKYNNLLTQNLKTESKLKEITQFEEFRLKDFQPPKTSKKTKEIVYEEIDDVEEIEERIKNAVPLYDYQQKPKIRPVVCMRCYKISKYGKLPETDCFISHRSPLQSLSDIFNPIKHRSVILKVVDIIDFNGSFIQEIYNFAKEKNCSILLILNKIDALPTGFKETRIFR